MTLNITDAELHEWANMRADDAGRLARELVACRLQSQAAVAAAYEAAAQVCDSGNAGAFWGKAIRALATPDQIAALAAERAATVTVKPLVWEGRSYEWSWWVDIVFGRGTYQIRCEGGIGYLVDFDGVTIGEPHDTLEAAKAAAQANYNARIRSAITITSGADRAKLDKAAEALQGLVRYQKSILADVLTAHSNRGAGASEWMREDDRDFMRDLRAAFEVSAAVLAEIGGA